ncbi:MAG TPA: hypothetical protein DCO80_13720 [Ornithinibacillus sp.]|nr:hypothetical protein [Ornithinibacillus sp.]
MVLLTACSETTTYNYKFSRESEYWEAEYSNKGTEKWGEKDGQRTYSNENSYKFVLKYKGSLEALSSLQKLEYSFEFNGFSSKSIVEFTDPPSSATFPATGTDEAKVGKDEVIKVYVKWDEFEESFELHNNSK